jgi:hypothetical protein
LGRAYTKVSGYDLLLFAGLETPDNVFLVAFEFREVDTMTVNLICPVCLSITLIEMVWVNALGIRAFVAEEYLRVI